MESRNDLDTPYSACLEIELKSLRHNYNTRDETDWDETEVNL